MRGREEGKEEEEKEWGEERGGEERGVGRREKREGEEKGRRCVCTLRKSQIQIKSLLPSVDRDYLPSMFDKEVEIPKKN